MSDGETREMLVKVLWLVQRLCEEAEVAGNPTDDRWKLQNIHYAAEKLIKSLRDRGEEVRAWVPGEAT